MTDLLLFGFTLSIQVCKCTGLKLSSSAHASNLDHISNIKVSAGWEYLENICRRTFVETLLSGAPPTMDALIVLCSLCEYKLCTYALILYNGHFECRSGSQSCWRSFIYRKERNLGLRLVHTTHPSCHAQLTFTILHFPFVVGNQKLSLRRIDRSADDIVKGGNERN